MALTLRRRHVRRAAGLAVAAAAALLLLRHAAWAGRWTAEPRALTGWLLAAVLVVLAALHVRKKLTRVPLGRAYHWVTVHVYLGLFSGVLLLVHVGFAWPRTPVNWTLLVLFTLVFGSGVFGLWLSRSVPRRLKERGEGVIYERLPALYHRLRHELGTLIEADLETGKMPALAAFAVETLLPFFAGPSHFWGHLFNAHAHRARMLDRLEAIGRFLNPREQQLKARLAGLVRAKDDLDYAYAHQTLLKYWLFVHLPLTYALLLLLPVHIAWGLIFR